MENEVSGIAKLGIVLIALAVLIGLGFGIFQISKSTANTGVGNVQAELDGVASSQYTTYDQTTITGTMASSAISDFEGESAAVLIATQAWINCVHDIVGTDAVPAIADTDIDAADLATTGTGFNVAYGGAGAGSGNDCPIVWVTTSDAYDTVAGTKTSDGKTTGLCFINYNAILGNKEVILGVNGEQTSLFASYSNADGDASSINMANVYFDSNCYRCVSGFATTDGGKTIFNNITSNISKTGKTEYIPSGAKFESFLIKDASGTTMGIALQQVNNG